MEALHMAVFRDYSKAPYGQLYYSHFKDVNNKWSDKFSNC